MIVSAVARGSSFKGVTAYLGGAGTEIDRAEWTDTQNVATGNIYMAARFMAATYLDADQIRRANGWDGRGRGVTDKPVYHIIMSWDESRHPDHQHQQEAARAMLKAAGLERAQAVLVGHNDNGKTHLHIVANLIDPDTGKQFSLSNDRRKMQAWALEYCREHGIEAAPNREKNAAAREAKQAAENTAQQAAAKEAVAGMEGTKRLSRQEWQAMRDEIFKRQTAERGTLQELQGADWTKAKAEMAAQQRQSEAAWRKELAAQKAAAKIEFRQHWRDMFKNQKAQEQAALQRMQDAMRAEARARTLIGRGLAAIGLGQRVDQAEGRATIERMKFDAMKASHEEQRKQAAIVQGRLVNQRTKEAVSKLPRVDLAPMKARHAQEWQATRDRQQAEREAAGIRHHREKAREQENRHDRRPDTGETRAEAERQERVRDGITREQQQDRQSKAGKWGAPLSDEAKEAARRMQERERRDKSRDDNGRER